VTAGTSANAKPADASSPLRPAATPPANAGGKPETEPSPSTKTAVKAVARVSAGGAATNTPAAGKAASQATTTRVATTPAAGPASTRSAQAAGRHAAGRAAKEAPPEDRKTDANIERILRLVRTRIGKDRSVATLRLDPPELGTVRLRMDLRQDQLTLLIETQSQRARHLLREHMDVLRSNLESAGVRLENVELRAVETADAGNEMQQSRHTDVGSGRHDESARSDDSAGGREDPGTDAQRNDPEHDVARDVPPEPAAESLVNVLA
jgi:flagellar hook-length control protein FliK